ncbi:MAG: 4Fe-4S binding protein [Dethiobacter sp.]|jgi:Fe-S-cluster-containing dehydrogenase component|nr:4Fe-4S binding protein [Dethiobacter sp.]
MADRPQISCDAVKCTGCRICMLACSWVNTKTHNPRNSFIRVDVNEKNFACRILLDTEKCRRCLSCVSFCPSGALQAVEAENMQEGGRSNGCTA